jgi:hypothetical protein
MVIRTMYGPPRTTVVGSNLAWGTDCPHSPLLRCPLWVEVLNGVYWKMQAEFCISHADADRILYKLLLKTRLANATLDHLNSFCNTI